MIYRPLMHGLIQARTMNTNSESSKNQHAMPHLSTLAKALLAIVRMGKMLVVAYIGVRKEAMASKPPW